MALKMKCVEARVYASGDDVISRDVEHDNAYWKVGQFDGTKEGVSFIVDVYEDSTKAKRFFGRVFEFVPSLGEGSKNIVAQAYDYMKSLDEFENAADC